MSSRAARTADCLPDRFNAAHDLIAPNLATRGDKIAVIDRDGATSYCELAIAVRRMGGVFASLGIGRGSRVLLCLTDTVDFPIIFLGAIRAGIVPVPLNTMLTTDDYRWMLQDSAADAVFVSASLSERWTAVAAEYPAVRFISSGDGPWPRLGQLMRARGDAILTPAETRRGDTAFWLYTSGSTGRPKAAMHDHSSMRLTANLFGLGIAGYRADDVVLSAAKLFFAYGLGNALTFPFAAGATAVLYDERPTPAAISALIAKHDVSILAGVPAFFAGWFASGLAPAAADVPALRLALSAGECLPAHIGEAFFARYGGDIIDGLGSTEMLHVFLSQRPGSVRYGCTGRPVPGYELNILDDRGNAVSAGEAGELRVRGPTAATGYWQNELKTHATFRDGWVCTGDRYSCDADGWYSYHGRTDDMLKVGGIYVSPVEVEEALVRHDAVLEAAVVGAADGDGLVKPYAYVVLRPGCASGAAIEDLLKALVKKVLAPYKYPRWFCFVDTLPKTATGKIQRYRLRLQDQA